MAILREQVFRVSRDVLFQEVDGEMVLLDMASEKYFGLDAIGARIWQMLHGDNSVGDILDALIEEYDVDRATLEADVGELLARLSEAGLISA